MTLEKHEIKKILYAITNSIEKVYDQDNYLIQKKSS